jgi:hypothetical protein
MADVILFCPCRRPPPLRKSRGGGAWDTCGIAANGSDEEVTVGVSSVGEIAVAAKATAATRVYVHHSVER